MIKILLNIMLGFILLNILFTIIFGLIFPWGVDKYKKLRKKELKMEDQINRIKKMD